MAQVRINPPGVISTSEGFISSITVRTAGGSQVLTPNAAGEITVSALAATRLVQDISNLKLVTG